MANEEEASDDALEGIGRDAVLLGVCIESAKKVGGLLSQEAHDEINQLRKLFIRHGIQLLDIAVQLLVRRSSTASEMELRHPLIDRSKTNKQKTNNTHKKKSITQNEDLF